VADLPIVLTAVEVAALLRINRKTLYEAVSRGEVAGAFKVGRALRFNRDTLLASLGSDVCTQAQVGRRKG
jgi:excisionase family DNA binding protein